MKIKSVNAKSIFDSRKEKTISISISTNVGNFSASSPTGKSTGKYETKPYKKSLDGDVKAIKSFTEYFSKEEIESFDDLRRIEDIVDGHVGANTIFALESAVLKALAKEQKKEIWQLINPNAKKLPKLVGNCVGGGKHSQTKDKKPDFQEFLLIPETKTVKEAYELNKKIQNDIDFILKNKDDKFNSKKNDENAWITSLNEKEVFDIFKGLNISFGTDIAASSFYKRKKYHYENPMLTRDDDEQLYYIESLIKNYDLFYIEDPFQEENFKSFAELLKKVKNCLIVGDDLIVTNSRRLKRAIEEKSVNAVIVKPNQCGSLLEVRKVCQMAKEAGIKTVFSHRSGETEESILADLAFGFQADFLKCGITGKEREIKIKRLIEIEKRLG
ncbi:MAG: enolase C-terminal domain-like protein [Nanoarchaeota archaeon]